MLCSLRGTDWVFIYNSVNFVLKRLTKPPCVKSAPKLERWGGINIRGRGGGNKHQTERSCSFRLSISVISSIFYITLERASVSNVSVNNMKVMDKITRTFKVPN